jgi:hypothetical protein
LIPWRTFEIVTSWSPDVAVIELKKSIDQSRLYLRGGNAPFLGDVRGTSDFQFSRRIGYRNSFLPVIRVVVEASWHSG